MTAGLPLDLGEESLDEVVARELDVLEDGMQRGADVGTPTHVAERHRRVQGGIGQGAGKDRFLGLVPCHSGRGGRVDVGVTA